jgi:hypothetical protein
MAKHRYIAFNGASPTTAAQVVMATGTSIATLLQVATPSTRGITVIEWGISFDGTAANTPIKCELLQTDVAATAGTSLTPTLYGDPNAPASLCVGGTGSTMFNDGAITEGTITAVRMFDAVLLPPTQPYFKQFPLGREPEVLLSKFLRVRVTAGTTVNAYCYIIWEE